MSYTLLERARQGLLLSGLLLATACPPKERSGIGSPVVETADHLSFPSAPTGCVDSLLGFLRCEGFMPVQEFPVECSYVWVHHKHAADGLTLVILVWRWDVKHDDRLEVYVEDTNHKLSAQTREVVATIRGIAREQPCSTGGP